MHVFRLLFFVAFSGVIMSILDPIDPIFAQNVPPANYDEAKIPDFTLPEPLRMEDGSEVKTAAEWTEKRRPEILALFEEHFYGKRPIEKIEGTNYEVLAVDKKAFGGKASRKELRIHFTKDKNGPYVDLLIYVPNSKKEKNIKTPLFLGYNFGGNHTVSGDPGVRLPMVWTRDSSGKYAKVEGKESERGSAIRRWNPEKLIDRGFGLVTAYYGDVDPDFDDGFKNGVHSLFYKTDSEKPAANEWGSIASWAWGLSRIMDYIETDADLDAAKVALLGHSRLGKTALWAGACDERFAIVISNNSGCGGAAISRREIGETIFRMNTVFPHWLNVNSRKYNERINECPVDQHQLIALIAPRSVYIASAADDQWADPKGEFLAGLYADPVYRLLGTEGFGGVKEMPPVDTPVGRTIRYHIRTGKHDIIDYDWEQYLKLAEEVF